jgi:hypothetical protein
MAQPYHCSASCHRDAEIQELVHHQVVMFGYIMVQVLE